MSVLDLGQIIAGVNTNLLHNWDFAHPANQPGIVSGKVYQAWMPFLDRWNIGSNLSTATITYTQRFGLHMTKDAILIQCLEISPADLCGKTYTLTIRNTDGTYRSVTGSFPQLLAQLSSENQYSIPNLGTVIFRIEYRQGQVILNDVLEDYQPMVTVIASGDINIRSIKLEAGTVSTLAYDSPMDYGRELQKCLRYYVNTEDGVDELKRVYNRSGASNLFTLSCDFMVPMRIKPTMTVYGDENYTHFSTWEYTMVTKFGFTVYRTVANGNWIEMRRYIADARL